MPTLILSLYLVGIGILTGSAGIVILKAPRSAPRRSFGAVCLALILWLTSLYALFHLPSFPDRTLLGRFNFLTVVWATYLGFVVIRELVKKPIRTRWLLAGTVALSGLTLLTPLIDRAELLRGGENVTMVGPLFFLFVAHVVLYPAAGVIQAVLARRTASPRLRSQLAVIALGLGVTACLVIVSAVILPYGFGTFRYQEIGSLSVVVLAGAIAYAITVQHLFDVRLVIRHALVIALLVTLVENVYSQSISLLVDRLPESHHSDIYARLISLATVLFIAGSFDPVKRWLEKSLDMLIFGRHRSRAATPIHRIRWKDTEAL